VKEHQHEDLGRAICVLHQRVQQTSATPSGFDKCYGDQNNLSRQVVQQ
jgi:hypothetical protein